MHFLINHPELRKDIVETLKLRQHDSDENVRYEVVTSIVSTAKKDFEIVSDSEDLLEFVKERTLDKKVCIMLRVYNLSYRNLWSRKYFKTISDCWWYEFHPFNVILVLNYIA